MAVMSLPGALHSPRGNDVILIIVDTLRADHVGLYGSARPTTPNIDRWFGGGQLYLRAYATAPKTPPAVTSILSGLQPPDHGVRTFHQRLTPQVPLVPDLLPPIYQSAAFVSNAVLTNSAIGFGARFAHYDSLLQARELFRDVYERRAAATTDAALAWLAHERDPARPLFLLVHYIDPHGPYDAPPPWLGTFTHDVPRFVDVQQIPKYQRRPYVIDGLAYVDRYDEEIAFMDHEVARLLEGYAHTRPIERALVVFTADHGETLLDHERWFQHGYALYEELVHVPLVIRGPGVEAGRSTAVVSSIDIAPTILRFADAYVPPALVGADLRDPHGLLEDRTVFADATSSGLHLRAAIRGTRKWVIGVTEGSCIVRQRLLYDRVADPLERAPRAVPDDDDIAQTLDARCRADLEGTLARIVRDGQRTEPAVSAAERRRLEALGYVE